MTAIGIVSFFRHNEHCEFEKESYLNKLYFI